MNGQTLPHRQASSAVTIGERLRAARERQGFSLRELASRVGLPPSAVSELERGQAMPSLGTLHLLTTELSLSMDDVVAQAGDPSGRPAADRLGAPRRDDPVGAADTTGATLAAPTGRVFRRADRSVLTLASGVRWELLTGYGPGTEFLRVTYPVGSQSCPPHEPIHHGGTERGVLLRGRLGVTLGDDRLELGPGDAIAFSSEEPHRLWAIGDEPAEAIWFVTGRSGG